MVFIVRDAALARPDPSLKVLPAAQVRAYQDARALIDDAMRRREVILHEAQEAFEAEKRRGYDKGTEEARHDQSSRMLTVVAQTAEYFTRVEQRMVELVLDAVQRVIETFDGRDLVAGLVQRALAEVRTQKQVTLRVHPDHVQALRSRVEELIQAYPAIECVDVVGDPRLAADACAVESDIGIVEASVEGQLTALREAFRSTFNGPA